MLYHILVAEADADVRTVLRRLVQLVYPAATVSAVANGQAALVVYTQRGADVVVIDHALAAPDALTLIRTLRAHNATLPIIALSGSPSAHTVLVTAGATHFLCKLDAVQQLTTVLPTLLPP